MRGICRAHTFPILDLGLLLGVAVGVSINISPVSARAGQS